MKIVMYAAIAALIAVSACADAQQMYDGHHQTMQQHHQMPPPRIHRQVPEYHHRPVEYERRVYMRPRIERERVFHRGYQSGGYAIYGGGYGNEYFEGERGGTYVHRESRHVRHERRVSAHRDVATCCCQGQINASDMDPTDGEGARQSEVQSEVPSTADYDLVRRVYKSIGP